MLWRRGKGGEGRRDTYVGAAVLFTCHRSGSRVWRRDWAADGAIGSILVLVVKMLDCELLYRNESSVRGKDM